MSTIRWKLPQTPDHLLEVYFEKIAGKSASPDLEPVFMELVNRCHDPLVGFIASRVRDPHHVEDLLQVTLMKAFEGRKTYDRTHPFRSWLFGIARHTIANHFRANGRRREDLTDWSSTREMPSGTIDQQRALLAKEEYSTLLHQVEEERDKRLLDAWIRHKFDDQSWHEIRDDMGWNITPESLRIACFRLVKSLKRVR